jgi:hypothetical protein
MFVRGVLLSSLLVNSLIGDAAGVGIRRIPNANHIFNAIHSSMRQWGSSLNHNGMSFFLATVPEGTQFYHGTHSPHPVEGSEWLAFEPEHALVFAQPQGSPGGPKRPDIEPKPRMSTKFLEQLPLNRLSANSAKAGYLHTYVTSKNLRLLYVDGMSAGKTARGTLDSQDRILLNDSLSEFNDRKRADLICEMADNVWEGRIDGVIRMEAGFEIILCHFERDLKVVRITQGPPRGNPETERRPKDPNIWVTAVASRYHGIGGHRVILDYDHFVTAYTYGLDLFHLQSPLPRLKNFSTEQLEPIRGDLHDLVMGYDTPTRSSLDWQAVTDMIVLRYSDELQNLVSGSFHSISELQYYVETLLSMFIDYSTTKNSEAISNRCAEQFIPKYAPTDTLAYRTVLSISNSICSNLTAVLFAEDLTETTTSLRELISYLSWTTWKECRGCKCDELCFIPMWPLGTVGDYNHPRCQERSSISLPRTRNESYWNGPSRRQSLFELGWL